jgi:hypothetical protein
MRRNAPSVDTGPSILTIGWSRAGSKRNGKKRSVNWKQPKLNLHVANSGDRER